MAVDLALLEKREAQKKLRAKFTAEKPDQKTLSLIKLLASRLDDGIQMNLKYARFWKAIDEAFDVAQRQTTYTLARDFLNRKINDNEDVLAAAKRWGLDSLMLPYLGENGQPQVDAKTGIQLYSFDLPTFFNIHVPVVAAYEKIRWARLFNDRDQFPLYRYEPLKLTMKNRVKCDIITDRIQRMATEMGYRATERQSIHQMLMFGACVNMPMEDWYKEEQVFLVEGKEQKRVIRSGVRYNTPHPWRTFYDTNHPLTTLNSDTGIEWYGFWDIMRYREILNSPSYWNKDRIFKQYGQYGWLNKTEWRLYQELFPCRFTFPKLSSTSEGTSASDRINQAYYSKQEEDNAVVLVSMFVKLIPSQWGLYDYDHPVWHWFVMGGEDTVLYAAPMAYTPGVAYLYDHDANKAFNSSLGLELIPWQDLLGNYLTQYLLSVKQNLLKVVFWNQDLLEDKYVTLIRNLGEKKYRDFNFIPFSRQEWSWRQQTEKDVFHSVNLPQLNTSEIVVAINTMIGVMERILGYSHLEIGAASTHEESATESSFKQQATSVRLDFTGSFVDDGINARKRALYDAAMAHDEDEIFAEVADLNDTKRKALKDMGWEVEEEEEGQQIKAGVRGSKKALVMTSFASEREGRHRVNDPKLAATMVQTFQAMFSNPAIVQATGIEQLVEMFNQILYYAGLPRDFRLRFDSDKSQDLQAQGIQEQLTGFAQELGKQTQELAVKAAQQVVGQEMAGLADGLREKVIGPIQQQQQQMGEAIMALLQRAQAQAQKDGEQDAAIVSLMETIQAAAAMPPVVQPAAPVPASMPVIA